MKAEGNFPGDTILIQLRAAEIGKRRHFSRTPSSGEIADYTDQEYSASV